ncbi:unnamed protein product (macronuclear) [Paramecium tetraurelia]|uniref:Uncharacterized protein n=1 Tax=Paramecium tetraurelia TaxID=5888 RepID=A0BGC0_PARTE|nr:uncharacterized protein GSPATT00028622001 [Paramecium tetraurelia]CAK57587.1 unnamed protein product [Paramecium tetraurelia]|eukprot:XP_001424985.1 hypothetical protein (macronuclear) [Paramecium tetraurelia strain d4-2]
MENFDQNLKTDDRNLQLSQQVLEQKREKIILQKKIQALEKQNKNLSEQMETYKIEKQERAAQIMLLEELIAKQDFVTTKLNGLIKKLLQRDEENQQHEHSLSAPKTDAKTNKYDNQERKKKDKQYLEEQQKLDLNEQIIAYYKKHSLKDQSASSKLPPIEDTKNKPIIVQVPKSQLKKINPQYLIEQMQKE